MEQARVPTEQEFDRVLCERQGKKVQEILKKSVVAIAGLGGLGSNIALALTRAGVGKLILVDFDRVELSNLNRQQYGVRHLGRYKTEALTEILLEVNPYVKIEAHTVKVDEDNVKELFGDAAILCEAFDVPENKAMLVNTALEVLPSATIVAASGLAGYGSSNIITTRRITNRFYLCGDGTSQVQPEAGLMAPRVMLCAGHEANMIIRLLLGYREV